MKDQSFLGEVGIVTGQEINIKHAYFYTSASPRLLLAACVILSFALGVVMGRDYLPVRYFQEGKAAMVKQKVEPMVLTIKASSAV